jgi:hypothetical protein
MIFLADVGTAVLLQLTYMNFPAGIFLQGIPSIVVISVYPSPEVLFSNPNDMLDATIGLVNFIDAETAGSTMSPALADNMLSSNANRKYGCFMYRFLGRMVQVSLRYGY